MQFDISHNGRTTLAVDYRTALELGYPAAVVGSAVKACALQDVEAFANTLRAQVASTAAGKLFEYSFKADIAGNESTASAEELALIDREAAARGLDRAGLLEIIAVEARKHRLAALLVGVLEAEMKAAVAAPRDDAADIETQVQAQLGSAKAAAGAELKAALAG